MIVDHGSGRLTALVVIVRIDGSAEEVVTIPVRHRRILHATRLDVEIIPKVESVETQVGPPGEAPRAVGEVIPWDQG